MEDQVRKKIIPNNGEQVQYGEWITKATQEIPVEKYSKEYRHGVSEGYTYSGQCLYQNYKDIERSKTTNLLTNKVTYGNWIETARWKKECGKKTQRTLNRSRGQEIRECEHHSGHSMTGFSRKPHTHFRIYREYWKEEYIKTTDYDRNITRGSWSEVSGSRIREFCYSDRERGWLNDYVREI
ncbi:hypothetical protein TRFO_02242 [Tritrichomonas foetus]|uniref:Uncharacterized protein n=1 Tax=Tritrichomonas foetus TaxID=1144522 RepID=A0A1J4J7Y4_9EUKA|nr:hypothetical protein TRFO_02242 [Tritrichomonas foetus]|eukprot:OHS95256.1 hypothetical protein TRFO_02242 [Tritrichomonas foetus]